MSIKWGWKITATGEPATAIRVEHHLTRDEITEIVCASTEVDTGTRMSQAYILHVVRDYLKAATVMEPVGFWSERYTEEEADERTAWAEEQVKKL